MAITYQNIRDIATELGTRVRRSMAPVGYHDGSDVIGGQQGMFRFLRLDKDGHLKVTLIPSVTSQSTVIDPTESAQTVFSGAGNVTAVVNQSDRAVELIDDGSRVMVIPPLTTLPLAVPLAVSNTLTVAALTGIGVITGALSIVHH